MGNQHGFLYNGSTYTTLDDPLAIANGGTNAYGVSGNNIVGTYNVSSGMEHGFFYNGSTYTTLDDPLGIDGTKALGIDGGNIVGMYWDSSNNVHGFLYNDSTWTTLDDPLAGTAANQGTVICGISGSNVVGWYVDSSDNYHGFVADISSVPEPSTLALLGVGAVALIGYTWRRNRAAKRDGRNGSGDPYHTDGRLSLGILEGR